MLDIDTALTFQLPRLDGVERRTDKPFPSLDDPVVAQMAVQESTDSCGVEFQRRLEHDSHVCRGWKRSSLRELCSASRGGAFTDQRMHVLHNRHVGFAIETVFTRTMADGSHTIAVVPTSKCCRRHAQSPRHHPKGVSGRMIVGTACSHKAPRRHLSCPR